jgi:hypothetical protein
MPDNVFTFEVDIVLIVVPNKEEKQVRHGKLLVSTKCIAL